MEEEKSVIFNALMVACTSTFVHTPLSTQKHEYTTVKTCKPAILTIMHILFAIRKWKFDEGVDICV
jgi:hypothetical protein